MEILHNLPYYKEPSVVALGNFDGIHLGHQQLIAGARAEAENRNCSSIVLTFSPHPEKTLFPERNLKLLLPDYKKSMLIESLGIDKLIYLPFTRDIAQWTPEEFAVKVLTEGLNAKSIYVGFNYTFGKRASGNTDTLSILGKNLGFDLNVLPPVKIAGQLVSSSAIRQLLQEGKVDRAKDLLGYWPVLTGQVVRGLQKGRSIGFPTANIKVEDDILLPQNGVYASVVKVGRDHYWAMTNIGKKPTIGKGFPVTVEINIFDFTGDLYGQNVEVSLCHRLREEQQFSSLAELTQQLEKDYKQSVDILNCLGDITTHIWHKR